MEIALARKGMEKGDIFLLCSDGLTDMVEDAQIASIMAVSRPLTETVDALINAANAAGGNDNISVILVRWTPDQHKDRFR